MRRSKALISLALAIGVASAAEAAEFRAGDIIITDPWARATAPHMPAGAAYLTIANAAAEPDTLLSARTPAAERVELHTHQHESGVMRMRPVPQVVLEAKSETRLAPGSMHLMLVGLERPLVQGESFPLTLTFERAGAVQVDVKVAGPGAQEAPAAGH